MNLMLPMRQCHVIIVVSDVSVNILQCSSGMEDCNCYLYLPMHIHVYIEEIHFSFHKL